ncbi:hypothetical protein TrCOL_g2946 [Triparma columacea]|uniref:Ribosomal RNA large subunit methyltransferase K/L-like methyltransferase domain-containing protein n=1 Tax=Triparma columacea TaxID=722753 RepID=A0A9W7GQG5_9STRA|nr:hypothetical protein TrCOL_g2946 [Triparma columacea]
MSITLKSSFIEDVYIKIADFKDVYGERDLAQSVKKLRGPLKELGIGRRKVRDLRVQVKGKGRIVEVQGFRGVVKGLGRSLDEEGGNCYVVRHPNYDYVEDIVLVESKRGGKGAVWVNCNGRGLGERGWRNGKDGKAPLKETIARALLEEAEFGDKMWGDGEKVVLDPFCGGGTVVIEAALKWRGGMGDLGMRKYNFQRWKNWSSCGSWASLQGDVKRIREEGLKREGVRFVGYDRDEGVVEDAKANAERAGVGDIVTFERRTISELRNIWKSEGVECGWIVTNPPWGGRIKGGGELRNLWGKFGHVMEREFKGWRIGVVAGEDKLIRWMGGKGWKKTEFGGGEKGIWSNVITGKEKGK